MPVTDTSTFTIAYEAADLINGPDGWTFNYCWREHGELAFARGTSDAAICRAVKQALGYSGMRHTELWDYGDARAIRLCGTCIGINWHCTY